MIPGQAASRVGAQITDAGETLDLRNRRTAAKEEAEQARRDRHQEIEQARLERRTESEQAKQDRILERREHEDDQRWTVESIGQYDREVGDFRMQYLSKPSENEGAETRDYADALADQYLKVAPTPQARDMFSRHSIPAANNIYEAASVSGERTRVTNSIKSNQTSTSDLIGAFKTGVELDGPMDAVVRLSEGVNFQLATIQARYSATAPSIAAAMTDHVVTEVVLATAPHAPGYARDLIRRAPVMEQERLDLSRKVDSIEGSMQQVERFTFRNSTETALRAAMETGKAPPDLAVEDFSLFGADAPIEFARYEAAAKNVNAALSGMKQLDGLNPNAQAEALRKMAAQGSDPATQVHLRMMEIRVENSAKLAQSDPLQWQIQNDPEVQSIREIARSMGNDPGFVRAAAYLSLERQGMPQGVAQTDDAVVNKDRYLGVETPRVLTVGEADERKRTLNAASPDEKLKFLDALTAEYGGDEYLAHIAYRDMLELGKEKIPVTYRFASIITDLTTRKEFIDSQTNSKAIAAISDEKKQTYAQAIEGNPTWKKFAMGWMGESAEGAPDVADAKAALIAYAERIHTSPGSAGSSATTAMKQAIEYVIGANYGFATVNGRVIPIPVDRLGGGPPRSASEIDDIGRRLGVALRDVPIQELAITNRYDGQSFYGLPPTFDVKKPEQAQILRDIITSRGFWQMDATGQMVTLMVSDPGRAGGFAVTDLDGQKLTVKLDHLPSFSRFVPSGVAVGGIRSMTDVPQGTWPLVEDQSLWQKLGFNRGVEPKTNWPRRQPWMTAPLTSPNLPE